MQKLAFTLFCFALCICAGAQDLKISGVVRSAKDSSLLQGVSVTLKGAARGTVTDASGAYAIVSPRDAILEFSSVGYTGQELPLNGNTVLDVYLEPGGSSDQLQEIVVNVGYGTRKRIEVTGAVDQISGAKIAERPVANIMQGLQGLSAGLNISYSGGAPGSTPNINIRGMGSINGGGGSPLILIDGVASQTDDLLRLNPSDVESITTLRDGASAAIYGARSAFGVIMIVTKKGKSGGRQTISYNDYFALSRRTVMPDPITDPYIYKKVMKIATQNTPWDYASFTPWEQTWAKQRSDDPSSAPEVMVNPDDPAKWAYMGNYNFNNYFFSNTNFSQYHTLSFSGSSAGKRPVNYLLSADYTKENGLIKITKNDWSRYGLRSNLGINPLSWLRVEDNLSVYELIKDMPSYNVTDVYYTQPVNVPKNPDGSWGNNTAGILAGELVDGGRNKETRFGFTNILRGTATLLNGDLTITGTASNKRELWSGYYSYLPIQVGYGPDDVREVNAPGSITNVNGMVRQDIYDLFANYNKTLGEHGIKLTAGYNQEYYQWNPLSVDRNQLISTSLPYIGLTLGTDPSITQTGFGDDYYDYAIRSYFGRADYSFKDKYIATFTARRDGSSRFPPNDRWAFTPGVSGAWVINKERFWEALDPAISTFKLRASYAKQGNQSVAYYGYIQGLGLGTSGYLINGAGRQPVTSVPGLDVDPNNYTWESVASSNFGTDIGLLKNHLNITFDYYVRNTTGMLVASKVLPGVLGTTAPKQNAADMSTKGWELTAAYNTVFDVAHKPFALTVKAQLWDDKSKITRYDNPLGLFSASYRQGQTIGEIWGLVNDGYFKDADDIAGLDESAIIPWGALNIVPGWPKYIDQDGDHKITVGTSDKNPADLRIIGNSSPRYRYSFNVDLAWNNIDLSLFIQGVAKMDYYPHHYLFWGPYQQPYANIYPWNLDFYRATAATDDEKAAYSQSYIAAGLANANLNSYYPVLQSWLADNNYGSGLDIPQTKYLLNAAYLRIKNLTFGYTLPGALTQRIKVSRLRIFFTGENLFEFSQIKKYVDPESIIDGYGWAYPYQRKYSVGINLDL
ncbi:SusC/RagA family protein [Niabella ginsenosidivorans]|uniref:SusC/RagA family protein n=1 Tax=Niabella ginsenosidivorans TaxID=1176587 RepID=A0A1A9I7K6_9BACT|nr:SusC/RagA family TonB-linked outer membrane protein [Niabella ginsenosidivorans]ANH83029.1 SusC/RagA family protein [Niabella ginsenosidivorans]